MDLIGSLFPFFGFWVLNTATLTRVELRTVRFTYNPPTSLEIHPQWLTSSFLFPLSVSLIDFTAKKQNKDVFLNFYLI